MTNITLFKVPKIILMYAIFLTLFTALMVGMSFFNPVDFFSMYGLHGDSAFQYAWSGRYAALLLIMIVGLIWRKPETIFFTIFARFLIDIFDVGGIILYNTPEFAIGNALFLAFGLIIPQLYCMYWIGSRILQYKD